MREVSIEERAIKLAHYIIDSKDTVRGTEKKFGISKSTVHKDVTLKNGRKYVYCIFDTAMLKFIWSDWNGKRISLKNIYISRL